jgi:hypothetical protein
VGEMDAYRFSVLSSLFLPEIFSLAGNLRGDGRDQHCVASQAVGPLLAGPPPIRSLNSTDGGMKLPKVSGHSLKSYRFPETSTRDRVRSALSGSLSR